MAAAAEVLFAEELETEQNRLIELKPTTHLTWKTPRRGAEDPDVYAALAAMGEEDLEEVEVEDAAEAFEKGAWCNAAKSSEASSERRPNAAPLALAEKEGTATGASAQFRDNLRLDREKMEELRQEHRSTIDDLHRQLRGKESALAKRQEEVQRHMKALERELQVASLLVAKCHSHQLQWLRVSDRKFGPLTRVFFSTTTLTRVSFFQQLHSRVLCWPTRRIRRR